MQKTRRLTKWATACGVVAAGAQALGEVGELRGGLGGQGVAGLRRAQALGVGEGGAEEVAPGAVEQVVEEEVCVSCTVLVKLVWMTMRSMSQTTRSGGFSSAAAYRRSWR